MNDLQQDSSKRWLAGVLILAAALRLWAIWHGYPYSFYPDEAHFVKRALSFGSGDLNPHWFHKPAFFMYLLFFEYGLFFILGKVVGIWNSTGEFGVFYIQNPGPFYLIGRITVSLFSVGVIWVTYLTSKKMTNRKVALYASLILAVSIGHTMVSKDIKADTPCAFFTILSVYFLIRFTEDKNIKDILFSSIAAGIGSATKYYTIVMLPPICAALFLTVGKTKFRLLLKRGCIFLCCILAFYFVYFCCSPFNFIDPLGREATFGKMIKLPQKIIKSIKGDDLDELKPDPNIRKKIDSSKFSMKLLSQGGVDYYLELKNGLGWIVLVMATAGIPLFLWRFFNLTTMGFLSFPFIFAAISIVLNPGYAQIRHQVVIYPFLAVLAAYSFFVFEEKVGLRGKLGYVVVLILFIPIIDTISLNMNLMKEDTRIAAKQWIENHIPPNTKLLVDENGPPLHESAKSLKPILKKAKMFDPDGQFTAHYDTYLRYKLLAAKNLTAYDIFYIRLPWWRDKESGEGVHTLNSKFDKDMGNPLRPVGVESYEYYLKEGYQYAIIQSNQYERFITKKSASKSFPSYQKLYNDLLSKKGTLKEFLPGKKMRGPIVKIIQISN